MKRKSDVEAAEYRTMCRMYGRISHERGRMEAIRQIVAFARRGYHKRGKVLARGWWAIKSYQPCIIHERPTSTGSMVPVEVVQRVE